MKGVEDIVLGAIVRRRLRCESDVFKGSLSLGVCWIRGEEDGEEV